MLGGMGAPTSCCMLVTHGDPMAAGWNSWANASAQKFWMAWGHHDIQKLQLPLEMKKMAVWNIREHPWDPSRSITGRRWIDMNETDFLWFPSAITKGILTDPSRGLLCLVRRRFVSFFPRGQSSGPDLVLPGRRRAEDSTRPLQRSLQWFLVSKQSPWWY